MNLRTAFIVLYLLVSLAAVLCGMCAGYNFAIQGQTAVTVAAGIAGIALCLAAGLTLATANNVLNH